MGFWHLIFGIFGGGDGAVSSTVIPRGGAVVVRFQSAPEVVAMRANPEVVAMRSNAEVVKFTR